MKYTVLWMSLVAAYTGLTGCSGGGGAGGDSEISNPERSGGEEVSSPDSRRPTTSNFTVDQRMVVRRSLAQQRDIDEWAQDDGQGAFDHLIPVSPEYPLPEVPSRRHDVATVRDANMLRPTIPALRTTADGRVGVAPTGGELTDGVDPLRFMLFVPEKLDRHFSLAADGAQDFVADEVWEVPFDAIMENGDHLDMVAICDTSHAQLMSELYGYTLEEPVPHRNPIPWGQKQDAYEFDIIGLNRSRPYELQSFPVRVVVDNPKTSRARIASIDRIGGIKTVELVQRFPHLFEPMITGDGRLLVARIQSNLGAGGGPTDLIPWNDPDGVPRISQFDIGYAYNPPGSGFDACDISGWNQMNFRPISYAYSDPQVRERYGFAKYPLRDSEGTEIPAGADFGGTYPWIDRFGRNLFFTAVRRLPVKDEVQYLRHENWDLGNELFGQDAVIDPLLYAADDLLPDLGSLVQTEPNLRLPAEHIQPLPGSSCGEGCDYTAPFQRLADTQGLSVAGLWTRGKMVMIDSIINNTDFPLFTADPGHRLMRLYHGEGGVVRVGNGRNSNHTQATGYPESVHANNEDAPEWRDHYPPSWLGIESISESLENLFNFSEHWKPAGPQDVVWVMNNGHGSDEFAFDDYLDEAAVIVSNMTNSVTYYEDGFKRFQQNTGDYFFAPLRLQNAATNPRALTPKYGYLVGDALQGSRIEPVALGGITGKGLWLSEATGLAYDIPQQAAEDLAGIDNYYLGLFLDPRVHSANAGLYRVLTMPSGTVDIGTDAQGWYLRLSGSMQVGEPTFQQQVRLPGVVEAGAWNHLGLSVNSRQVTVYINGFRLADVPKNEAESALALSVGRVVFGSPDGDVVGLRGWFDEVKLIARPMDSEEETCIHAHGSMIRVAFGQADPDFPEESHLRIARKLGDAGSQRYACATDYASDSFGYLTRIPDEKRVGHLLKGIQPLRFGAPRPDESRNSFCLTCHKEHNRVSALRVQALDALSIPMEWDIRRQPLQPFPAAIGHIPMGWIAGPAFASPANDEVYTDNLFLVDEALHP